MKDNTAIHPAIMENTENLLVKHTPHTSTREIHLGLISAMSSLFHNIISME